MKTQAEYFLANQVNGDLTTEQMSHMLTLPEGDMSSLLDNGDTPGTGTEVEKPEPEKAAADPVVEKQPVILAKDGVHTIPYEQLVEARANEKALRELADRQAAELEALKKQPATPATTTDPAPAETQAEEVDFGDFSDEAIKGGIKKIVAINTAAIRAELKAELTKIQEPLLKSQQEAADEAHFGAIEAAHGKGYEALVTSKEMNDWIEAQPSFSRPAMRAVIDSGTAPEVIELLNVFKAATGVPNAGKAKQADPAAAAQAAIAKAQAAPPSSLSEIPAGSTVHHDEIEALSELSAPALMARFNGKSAEQIMESMSRLI